MATSRSGFETVSIHMAGERVAGFSNIKSIALNTLELIDYVHRFAVHMGVME